jgi:hypothetical protein
VEKTVYDLKLHESINFETVRTVLRVPGGWIYELGIDNGEAGWEISTTFVPFDNEFQRECRSKG